MSEIDSGGSCEYYRVNISHTVDDRPEYTAECAEITQALELEREEANMFKEIWRMARARQGVTKKGNTRIRGLQKIQWYVNWLIKIEEEKNAYNNSDF